MNKEIAVEKLKQNKKVCVRKNAFGDDNIDCLDIMIRVISNSYDEEDIYRVFKNNKYDLECALSALDLVENNFENIEEYLFPIKK